MKQANSTFFKFALVLCLFAVTAFGQYKSNTVTYQSEDIPVKKTDVIQQETPAALSSLIEQQKTAKRNGNNGLVNSLQQQIDTYGQSVSVTYSQSNYGTGYFLNAPWNEGDNVIQNRIFATPSGSFLKAFATAVEQRGSNVGRIWASWAWGSTTFSTPDTILVYYSDNGGLTWSGNSIWIPGGFAKVNYDQMDMEIMEYTTGQKYVWITAGFTNNANQENVAAIIVQTPTPAGNFIGLTWPGGATNTNVYGPHITSDNANYPTTSSWLFFTAARDTLSAANTHKIGEKFAKCTNPFTTTPTITYKGACFFYDGVYGGTGTYYNNADHCDIAYFRNGGADSIIVLESNVPDTTIIYAMKSDENADANNPLPFASLNGGGSPVLSKKNAKVCSNGDSRIMIVYRDSYNNTQDWDIRYILSTTGGIAAANWANGYIDSYTSTTTYPFQPDIAGLRGTSSFKVSYVYFSSGLDSAMIVANPTGGTTWGNPWRSNITGTDVSVLASSHAMFRYINNDSCLTLWSEYSSSGGLNLWTGAGCTGSQITGIHGSGNTIPKSYVLFQNYPNPFNPSTKIEFALPKAGFVKIAVYDITGKVVELLANKLYEAGTHELNFNASNYASGIYLYKIEADGFTDVKKMMLIK